MTYIADEDYFNHFLYNLFAFLKFILLPLYYTR